MILTTAVALTIAQACVPPLVAPVMVAIAQHESNLVSTAIHDNVSGKSYAPATVEQAIAIARSLIAVGHASLDLGLAQVTTANFAWTGLTVESAFDPCRSFAAGASVLLAKYNGRPPDPVKAAYAADVLSRARALDHPLPPDAPADPPPCAPAWDAWALVACNTLTSKDKPDANH